MAYKSTSSNPTDQACLDLFPDPLQTLQLIKDHLAKADERHRSLLCQAAQTEIKLYKTNGPIVQTN